MSDTTRILITATSAVLACACSESATGPRAHDVAPSLNLSSPRVFVLNAQLRGIIDPEIEPTGAWGHVQVKLTEAGDDGYRVQWKGKLFNPDGLAFSDGYIINPEIVPVLYFFSEDIARACSILEFEGIIDPDIVPAEIALGMIINPDIHEVIVTSSEGPIVTGRFGVPNPGELVGFNPQPDPPAERVRCDVAGLQVS